MVQDESTHQDRVEAQFCGEITQRMSLRAPQARALSVLADVLRRIGLRTSKDTEEAVASIKAGYPGFESFERDFPSLCFALATGVGKTRLIGAFISLLFLSGRTRNFFVLAPNATVYEKLIADFSIPHSAKYVFKGIDTFARAPPLIVTGDTWDDGQVARQSGQVGPCGVINIFNVDKINKERGRIRSIRETIGQSYFDHLAGLDDLVIFMDEAHRYRAGAGMRAISGLRPALGVELTATPVSVGKRPVPFRNVVFSYGLGEAMTDGFVKEPAVATRADFRPDGLTPSEIERVMLEDGVRYHEHVKRELDLYARQSGRRRVHPFMLVVAQDTAHASSLRNRIENDDFFHGAYKGRVAEVHSNLNGGESDEAIARLVSLERDDSTEIVIHVNKLKEGWDVTNLFTIVPLRASASDILTEQTLGRGLRLPYGARTGVEAIDTLTVIAHDRFDEVIRRARENSSSMPVRSLTIGPGGDIWGAGERVVSIAPVYEQALMMQAGGMGEAASDFEDGARWRIVRTTMELVASRYERRLQRGAKELAGSAVRAELVAEVRQALSLHAEREDPGSLQVDEIVGELLSGLAENLIEIPEIVVVPDRQVSFWFDDFELENLEALSFHPPDNRLLVRRIRDNAQRELGLSLPGGGGTGSIGNIVRRLTDYDQIDYETNAVLIHKLAGQVVDRLRSQIAREEDVERVTDANGRDIARFVFEQMMCHYHETPPRYHARLSRTFRLPRPFAVTIGPSTQILDIHVGAVPLARTPECLFEGTRKSAYPLHRFQSDAERRFACLLENPWESDVLRWLKPGPGQFRIDYRPDKAYDPDFVVETIDRKLIVEIKADGEIGEPVVMEKAAAALRWVGFANGLAAERGDKPWAYALVPETAVRESATLAGLVALYAKA